MQAARNASTGRHKTANTMPKESKWEKAVGKKVKVKAVGFGVLRYFGETELDSGETTTVCGVELDAPEGDGDGSGYFECVDGHALFTSPDQLTLVDAEGKAIKKSTKAKATPAWKTEAPSLRKTIGKKSVAAGGSTASRSMKSSPSSTRNSPSTTRKSMGGPRKTKSTASTIVLTKSEPASVRRAKSTASPAPAAVIAEGDTPAVEGGEPASGGQRPAFNAPEDWMEAAKRAEKEKAEEERKRKEAEDLKAQEERLKKAEVRRAAEEEEFNRKAAEAAAKRDAAKAERAIQREKEAAERAARREAAEMDACLKIAEAHAVQERMDAEFEERDRILEEKRAAQKARIAAIMSKVKNVST